VDQRLKKSFEINLLKQQRGVTFPREPECVILVHFFGAPPACFGQKLHTLLSNYPMIAPIIPAGNT
jgi:hypothetical protein